MKRNKLNEMEFDILRSKNDIDDKFSCPKFKTKTYIEKFRKRHTSIWTSVEVVV